MPTYSYQCEKCNHLFDVFHAMSATPRIKCEKCGGKCTRQIGVGAGIIFKGSGFYETDFKNKKGVSTPPEKTSSSSSDKPAAKSETKNESKSAAKPAKSS